MLGLAIALAVLVLALLLSLVVGTRAIPADEAWRYLWVNDGGESAYIVREMRLPRALLGLVVGCALGVAGALIQALTRNPLADTGILGVGAGASFAIAIGVGFLGITSIHQYLWLSFGGAVLVTVLVYVLGSAGPRQATPIRLTLVGVALGAVLGGFSGTIALLRPENFEKMRGWGVGSLAGRGWDVLAAVSPFILIGIVIAVGCAGALNAVALGDDLARSLGANLAVVRILVIIAVTLLAGAATGATGPIGFVGLMIPHAARWIVGPDQRWILAYTIVCAPILLVGADIIGRIMGGPIELEAGIVTAFVGAPVLILLARKRKLSGL
ncbi:Fe(3+)-siderophore ABC transporter permease [Mycetocola tolaasinivorans]|uniref:Fe(3+)-siderophore ABC transporter permease n=2 Tax=Mycetocola tolaasinivorans TaxID=76635 RepID=A0A3L7AB71_9MICO|nr:Fe(3+)-siderophore ABC transporter permease [Mycetocola tolaasinivorans]